jgi:hypothetical protein
MSNNRTIILSGAGAAIPWGAPTTKSITDIILSDKAYISDTGQPIGSWLHHKLIGLYHRDPETVNFETIINAVEYLITFFVSKQRGGIHKFKNLMPAFFEEKSDLWELLFFDKIYPKTSGGLWHNYSDRSEFYRCWNDNDYFFESVFQHFINLIIKQIDDYSKKANLKVELNNKLNGFLHSVNKPLRCYTTNYDRIIPAIYTGEMFEGFTKEGDDLKFDFKKVLIDETSNTYYNLHGSIHYDQDWPGNVKYDPNNAIYNFGRGSSGQIDQDSRTMMNSNIITGFNKSSRILTNPYSQFYLRFYQDCLFADKIFIVGYSFSDTHINSAIKTASLANKNLQINCISHMLYNEDPNMEGEYDWITLEGNGRNFLSSDFIYNIGGIADKNNVDRISIYRKGFEQYLMKQQWESK